MASSLPACSSHQNCSSLFKPHVASTNVTLSQLPTHCFVQHINRPPGRGGAVLLSDLPWTPTQGAQPRQGPWPGRPSSRLPGWRSPGTRPGHHPASSCPHPTSSHSMRHMAGSQKPTPAPQEAHSRAPAAVPPSNPRPRGSDPCPQARLGAGGPAQRGQPPQGAQQKDCPAHGLQASGCRLRLTKRFQCVGMQS